MLILNRNKLRHVVTIINTHVFIRSLQFKKLKWGKINQQDFII